MRRAERLFDIIQTLRTARRPVTAAALGACPGKAKAARLLLLAVIRSAA